MQFVTMSYFSLVVILYNKYIRPFLNYGNKCILFHAVSCVWCAFMCVCVCANMSMYHHCYPMTAILTHSTLLTEKPSLFSSKFLWSLTHWGRDKWTPFRSQHFQMHFLGPINNISAMVQIMAWRRSGAKPFSGPMVVSLPTHMCVARPQLVNEFIKLWGGGGGGENAVIQN